MKVWSNETHSEIVLAGSEEVIEVGFLLRQQQMGPLSKELPSLLLEPRH
jgi:hypothetical protein